MFFSQKPLYDAKQDTLKQAIEFINLQAKILRECVNKIRTRNAEINSLNFAGEVGAGQIESLGNAEKIITKIAERLSKNRDLILDSATSRSYYPQAPQSLNVYSYVKYFQSHFEDNLLPDMQILIDTNNAFIKTCEKEKRLISSRQALAAQLLEIYYLIRIIIMHAVALIVLTLCVNLLIGIAVSTIILIASMAYNRNFSHDLNRAKHYASTTNKPIDLVTEESLFKDLDELISTVKEDNTNINPSIGLNYHA